ncbi:hypothetical protein B0A52_09338 [Exophiala mesophila]|uniref:MOSC domain-containing protein n=1 Tax=Exophiala mesophila TaxID=212818 RepID=A0A438MUA5_EXOME|nr:hypothetical protein B0A52_09338 [Exophiala mesophila]
MIARVQKIVDMVAFEVFVTTVVAGAVFAFLLRRFNVTRVHPSLKGYQKLGTTGPSNLLDEYDSVYTIPQASQTTRDDASWKVKALLIHPIKSCAPVELSSAEVNGTGFVWDRKFAFAELLTSQARRDAVDEAKKPQWTFRTQRTPGYEKLAHVRSEVWLRTRNNDSHVSTPQDGWLIVSYPYTPSGPFASFVQSFLPSFLLPSNSSFSVPLELPDNHDYPVERVTIWKDSPLWVNVGRHVPESFRLYLGAKNALTLFRVDPNSPREVFRCAPRKEQLGYQANVGFADAYPVHLLNISSVHDIGERVKEDIPRFSSRRFRPNILIQGPAAFNEDDWKIIRIGTHVFFCACHTVRCRLPNVDPDTGARHPVEPDKTLKSFRCIDDGDPLNACLGLQLVPAEGQVFQVHVGDEVVVLERGEHHYIKQ